MWGVGFGVPSHVRLSLTWWQDAWVAPTGHLGAPFNQQKEGCGALSTLTEEQVAVRLLSLTKRLSGPCKVVFRRLRYEDESLSRIRTQGFDDTPPIVVQRGLLFSADGRAGRSQPKHGADDFDLMGLFATPNARQSKKQSCPPRRVTLPTENELAAELAAALGVPEEVVKSLGSIPMFGEVCDPAELRTVQKCLDEVHAVHAAEQEGEEIGNPRNPKRARETAPPPTPAVTVSGPEAVPPQMAPPASPARAEAVPPEPPAQPQPALEPAAPAGVVAQPGWWFADPAGRRLGNIRALRGTSLKATCSRHRACTCWVTWRGGRDGLAGAERDLVEWLSKAPGSAEAHADAMRALRARYSSRVRPGAP